MKSFLTLLSLYLLLVASTTTILSAQSLERHLSVEVHQKYPYLSLTRVQLQEAEDMGDLNRHYKDSWVKKYYETNIYALVGGNIEQVSGTTYRLNTAQKALLAKADLSAEIKVNIRYLPQNQLKNNTEKTFDFAFSVEPDRSAQYPGDPLALQQFLKSQLLDKINKDLFTDYQLWALDFTVATDGSLQDLEVHQSAYQTFQHPELTKKAIQLLSSMEKWTPAQYADGKIVPQRFVLTVGDLRSCIVPTLGIRSSMSK